MFFIAEFWIFLFVLLLIYAVLRKASWQNLILLLASYLVYAYFSGAFVLLLIALTTISYLLGPRLSLSKYRRLYLGVGVALNLIALIAFKYVLAAQLATAQTGSEMVVQNVLLPLGISFYIFRLLSYLFDVYARRVQPGSWLEVAVYVAFFPQIASGPIERATTFLPRLKTRRVVTQELIVVGITYIFVGIFYKMAIADPLAQFTNNGFAQISSLSSTDALALLILFAVRLYADFAGYSAIAIGISTWFGLPAMENFKEPYFSRGIVEFWTRWHISLSSWIRDYFFFPVSRSLIKRFGSRFSFFIQNVTMFTTMVLIGLWHGLTLPFLAWGALHGTYMVGERLIKGNRANGPLKPIGPVIGIPVTLMLVSIAWIFFGASSLADANVFFTKLFSFNYEFSSLWWTQVLTPVILLLAIDTLKSRGLPAFWRWNPTLRAAIVIILVIVLLTMSSTSYAPFIYQNF